MLMNNIILTFFHDFIECFALANEMPTLRCRNADAFSAQCLNLILIEGVAHSCGKIDLELTSVRIAYKMHQLVLYPADIHSAGYNQYFGLTHKRALLRFDLQHINKSIIRLHLIRTGKAIHQHFQPTGLIFSARYNLQIFRISRRRCLAEQLNFSNSLQQE